MKDTVSGFAPVESLAVMHSTTPEVASQIADDLKHLLPKGSRPYISRSSPALGVYAGPGAIGVAVIKTEG